MQNLSVNIEQLIQGVTQLAGGVPFLVLRNDGSYLGVSDGARDLIGGVLEIEGQNIAIEEHGVFPAGPLISRDWKGERSQFTMLSSERMAFCIHTKGIPEVQPQLYLVRFDPVPISYASSEGFYLRAPHEYPDAIEFYGLWTRSQKMKELFEIVSRAAQTDVTVLVRGESGTGKEGIARAIHQLSKREDAPFVAVNCAALSPTLLESELFGHVKGAFTGAIRERVGLFERAEGGTIFLDEIAELPKDLQAKLLRVLQERTYVPVGGSHPKHANVRVISATHQSLRQAVTDGVFREDLMFRLRVVPMWIPALRERREDIELLASTFLLRLGDSGRHKFKRIHPKAMQSLMDYQWTGNVRELQNVMEYVSVVGSGDVLTIDLLPPEFRESRRRVQHIFPQATPELQDDAFAESREPWPTSERELLVRALASANGKKGKAAEILGMHRTTLWRKMKEYGLTGW